ncbi:MAG: nucleotide sugar dehydrogenase [Melioribacteraceae bacterium]|nr:nucleotide sugar dehydrogenase [Melioribacteraceae bacterium]
MNYKENLLKKIEDKSATVGIIGLGYVGLPLALEFVLKGFNTIGFDIDEKKIPILMNCKSYIKHISEEKIFQAVQTKNFIATTDFSKLSICDAIIICVPTPLDHHREPDLTFIEKSGEQVAEYIRAGQFISLESSTYPGTTEEILQPLFEAKGLKVGEDFFLAFSPEREDPNNPDFSTSTIPKVVGGVTPSCLEIAQKLYDQVIIKTVPVSSPRAAEATKLLENIYRSINIALVNELKMVFDKMEIDIWEVIEAAKTKPFGFQAFYPGPGLGGHCIPIDPFYLTWKAREYDVNTKFIELAGEINTYQPYYVVQKLSEALDKNGKTLKGSKILILGASYKKNIDDMRESPSLKLIEILQSRLADVEYSDNYVKVLPATRKYNFEMKSVDLTPETIKSYDAVLLSTDHDNFDYEMIYKNAQLIVDTRNAFAKRGFINVVKA